MSQHGVRLAAPFPSDLQTVVDRTGKEIAHLTTRRLAPDDPGKAWSPEPILRLFFGPLKRFASRCPARPLSPDHPSHPLALTARGCAS